MNKHFIKQKLKNYNRSLKQLQYKKLEIIEQIKQVEKGKEKYKYMLLEQEYKK